MRFDFLVSVQLFLAALCSRSLLLCALFLSQVYFRLRKCWSSIFSCWQAHSFTFRNRIVGEHELGFVASFSRRFCLFVLRLSPNARGLMHCMDHEQGECLYIALAGTLHSNRHKGPGFFLFAQQDLIHLRPVQITSYAGAQNPGLRKVTNFNYKWDCVIGSRGNPLNHRNPIISPVRLRTL